MVERLVGALDQLSALYEKMLELSTRKNECIVKSDVQAVGDIVKEEWLLLSEIGKAEEERARVVCEIDAGVVAGTENITVQNVIDAAQGEEKKRLSAVADRLKALIDMQKKLNAESRALIELQLQYVDFMINTFLKEPQVSNIYGNSGIVEETETEHKGIIDNQV